MGNGLKNAGFIDGLFGYAATAGATTILDEIVLGGPGRAVATASGTGGADIWLGSTYIAAPPVTPGKPVEAFAWYDATIPAEVRVTWISGARQFLSETPLKGRQPQGAVRGLPTTFGFGYGRPMAPAGAAFASIVVRPIGAPLGPWRLSLLKPYLDPSPRAAYAAPWDAGTTDNPDLDLERWPVDLPPILDAGWSAEPTALSKGFTSDNGFEASVRRVGSPRWKVRGRMALTPAQQDSLQTFREAVRGHFWFHKPDTFQLCRALWSSDGDPKPVSQGAGRTYVEFGLQLQVA